MQLAYAILAPLLLLGGCATTGMGPHGAQGQAMQNCPMMSAPDSGDQQHGAIMGERAGQGHGQMMQGMHQGDMANCPMARDVAPSAPEPNDPHQH